MEKAYNFKLNDSEGNEVALHDFLGQKVVVYFYPKDSTPGCTKQACSYRDHFADLVRHPHDCGCTDLQSCSDNHAVYGRHAVHREFQAS